MRRSGRLGVVVAIVALLGVTCGSASASWRRLGSVAANYATPEMVRTADGTLVVAYNPANDHGQGVNAVRISAGGVPVAPVVLVKGWLGTGQPAILTGAGRLFVAWHGCPTCAQTDPLAGLDSSASADGGRTWSAPARNDASLTGDLAAVFDGPRNSPYFAWDNGGNGIFTARVFGLGVHKQPNSDGLNENLGFDQKTGELYLAVVHLHHAVTIERLDADAVPTGTTLKLPDLQGHLPDDPSERVSLASRPGGGVYLADGFGTPSARWVGLWRIGSPSVHQIAVVPAARTAITGAVATRDGRIWVMWRGADEHVLARRSNPSVTEFGPTIDAGVPAAATFAPVGSATPGGGLDLIVDAATVKENGLYYKRLLPKLSLDGPGRTLTVGRGARFGVKFTVSDAGAPVRGATVAIGPHTARTGAGGTATVEVPGLKRTQTLTGSATARGYGRAHTRVRVVVKPA